MEYKLFSRKDFWDRMLRYWFSLNMLNSIDQLQLTLSTKTRQTTALKACSHSFLIFAFFMNRRIPVTFLGKSRASNIEANKNHVYRKRQTYSFSN